MHVVLLRRFCDNGCWAFICAKKESSKHSILSLCLKSGVVIELEYVCVLTLQCAVAVKAFWVLVKILGFYLLSIRY